MFYNQADSDSLTVDSVSLLQPHNLTLHTAVVYKMHGYRNSLPLEWAWTQGGVDVPKAQWAARQPVPGAVIPAQDGPLGASDFEEKQPDLYEIAVDVSASSPAGGWALGEVIKYRAGGKSYTFTFKVGMAVASASQPPDASCEKMISSISSAFKSSD